MICANLLQRASIRRLLSSQCIEWFDPRESEVLTLTLNELTHSYNGLCYSFSESLGLGLSWASWFSPLPSTEGTTPETQHIHSRISLSNRLIREGEGWGSRHGEQRRRLTQTA